MNHDSPIAFAPCCRRCCLQCGDISCRSEHPVYLLLPALLLPLTAPSCKAQVAAARTRLAELMIWTSLLRLDLFITCDVWSLRSQAVTVTGHWAETASGAVPWCAGCSAAIPTPQQQGGISRAEAVPMLK